MCELLPQKGLPGAFERGNARKISPVLENGLGRFMSEVKNLLTK